MGALKESLSNQRFHDSAHLFCAFSGAPYVGDGGRGRVGNADEVGAQSFTDPAARVRDAKHIRRIGGGERKDLFDRQITEAHEVAHSGKQIERAAGKRAFFVDGASFFTNTFCPAIPYSPSGQPVASMESVMSSSLSAGFMRYARRRIAGWRCSPSQMNSA